MINKYLFSPLRAIQVGNEWEDNMLFAHFFSVFSFHGLGVFFYFKLFLFFDTLLFVCFGIFAMAAAWFLAWYVLKYVEVPKDNNWKWKLLGWLIVAEPYIFLIACTIAVIGLPQAKIAS